MTRVPVLTIAGSDPSGGAGIQADLKTFSAFGVYGMSAVTALTVQNTQGVAGVYPACPDCLQGQLEAVFTDIPPAAVKTGMLYDEPLLTITADALARHAAPHVVVDPVLVSSSGHRLLSQSAESALTARLLPLAQLVTPNLPELEALWGFPISSRQERIRAARELSQRYSCAVLAKGGHPTPDEPEGADDLLIWGGELFWFPGQRVDNPNNHGTGCTLSSAIAAGLALGRELPRAVKEAKEYLTGALSSGLKLGRGSGPLDHLWNKGD